jgi:cell division septal protein FtsQ
VIMARGKSRRKTARRREAKPGWYASLDAEQKQRLVKLAARVVVAVAAAAGIGLGMAELDRRVHAAERFSGPPQIVLAGVPTDLDAVLREHLQVVSESDWTEPDLCRRIAIRLAESGWVARVDRVRRQADGRVEVSCRYRTPFALVQCGRDFLLVDAEGVRLPGRYPFSASLPLVQGVAGPPPDAGRAWEAKDLQAGVGVLRRLRAEPFADQVTAVLVHNYGGREDRHTAHLELATDRAGGRIIWGSAAGEEIEENTAAQKLAILRRNYELHGRADAGLAVIDVSTFPDRFTTPNRV